MNKRIRVGIITIHKSTANYGACLQCYALWKYISSLGYDCEVVDLLRPSAHENYISSKNDKVDFLFHIKERVRKIIAISKGYNKIFKNRFEQYKKFNSNVKYSREYRSVDELYSSPPIYDIYISGSDQIWNPNMLFDIAPYLLSFAPKGSIKLAYASSFAIGRLPENVKQEYAKYLRDYSFISVREDSGKSIVSELLNKDATVVLDPVFLIEPQAWIDMSDNFLVPNKKYILIYSLDINQKLVSVAKDIAKNKDYSIIMILAAYKYYTIDSITQNANAGPLQWLGLIKNAELLLTDSFHGTVFSMQFGINFLCYIDSKSKVNDRIISLARKFNIENNFVYENQINSVDELLRKSFIDYSNLFVKIKDEVDKSKKYIIDALNRFNGVNRLSSE